MIREEWDRLHKNPALAGGRLRRLTQPEKRLPLPAHLSQTTAALMFAEQGFTESARRAGINPAGIRTLTLVYPHKHPGAAHYNPAQPYVRNVKDTLTARWPQMTVIVAEGLFEEESLDRSTNQSALHALRGRQHYGFDIGAQADPLPFVLRAPTPADPDLMVLVDDCVEQGTTAADWASFLHHNGGTVIAVMAGSSGAAPLAQADDAAGPRATLVPPFNTGLIPVLADEFARTARAEGTPCTPDSVTALFEHALNRHGRSLMTLTHMESYRLRNETRQLGVGRFLTLAGCAPAEQKAFLAACQP